MILNYLNQNSTLYFELFKNSTLYSAKITPLEGVADVMFKRGTGFIILPIYPQFDLICPLGKSCYDRKSFSKQLNEYSKVA